MLGRLERRACVVSGSRERGCTSDLMPSMIAAYVCSCSMHRLPTLQPYNRPAASRRPPPRLSSSRSSRLRLPWWASCATKQLSWEWPSSRPHSTTSAACWRKRMRAATAAGGRVVMGLLTELTVAGAAAEQSGCAETAGGSRGGGKECAAAPSAYRRGTGFPSVH